MIRIEIGVMPALLRSIVRSALETQGDFTVVAALPNEASQGVDAVDVVVVSDDHEKLGRIPVAALLGNDSPGIVAIAADGHSASILRLVSEHSRLDAASDLSDVVRQAAFGRGALH